MDNPEERISFQDIGRQMDSPRVTVFFNYYLTIIVL
jgi:hypothetical protein